MREGAYREGIPDKESTMPLCIGSIGKLLVRSLPDQQGLYPSGGKIMRRCRITVALMMASLLAMAVLPVMLDAQPIGEPNGDLKDFRERSNYTADDISRALFPAQPRALGRDEPKQVAVPVAINVSFESGSDKILPKYYPDLDKLGTALAQNAAAHVRIEGYTDNVGSVQYNQALSERRAESVKRYLVGHFPKIVSDHLSVKGFGPSKPRALNNTAQGRAQNRRIEVVNLDEQR
jgi:outer membrane protein OmpA-like peptidoglycan-associated protein